MKGKLWADKNGIFNFISTTPSPADFLFPSATAEERLLSIKTPTYFIRVLRSRNISRLELLSNVVILTSQSNSCRQGRKMTKIDQFVIDNSLFQFIYVIFQLSILQRIACAYDSLRLMKMASKEIKIVTNFRLLVTGFQFKAMDQTKLKIMVANTI